MPYPNKENNVLELFFNEPTKHWHFKDIVKNANISEQRANYWLKQFLKEGLIRRKKKKGKMPYYVGNHESYSYRNRKKLFASYKLYNSGFLNHLSSLPKAKTVILFGSFARSDWHSGSDIDIFIYGETEGLKLAKYEIKLHRDVQVFDCSNKEGLIKLGEGLIRNIIKGSLIKGDIGFLKVEANA